MLAPIFACVMGCGPQTTVMIDASVAAASKGATHFVIVAENPAVTPSNRLFQEWSAEVARALQSQGFQKADSLAYADLVVKLDWDVGPPKTVTRHGTTQQLQNAGNTEMAPAGKSGTVAGPHNKAAFDWVQTPADWKVTTYVRTLSMKAMDKAGQPLWQTVMTSEGLDDDVGPVVAEMAAAGAPFFGQSTGDKPAKRMIGSLESNVKYVRGDAPPPSAKK